MKKYIAAFILALSVVPIFQNCSVSSGVGGTSSSFSMEALYPYSSKPTYFDSVQLIDVSKDGSGWKYQFLVSVVNVDDPTLAVDVQVKILNSDGSLLCPRANAQMTNTNNNYILSNCASGQKVETLDIKLWAKLSTESSMNQIQEYTFTVP